MLELGDDPDLPVQLARELDAQVEDLLEGRDLVAAVASVLCWRMSGMRSLACSVLSSASVKSSVNQPVIVTPSIDLGRPAVGELGMVGDVGRPADLRLVADDEHVVLRGHEVGLDVVGAHARGERVGPERVLGPVAGGAAVTVDR